MARKIGLSFGRYWTEEQDREFASRYEKEGATQQMCRDMGRTAKSLHLRARKLGILCKRPRWGGVGRHSNSFSGFISPDGDVQYDVPATVIAEVRTGLIRGSRRLDLEIDEEYLYIVLKSQNGLCRFTGDRISFMDETASVDRIDSSKGYVKGNIQIVTNMSNLVKGSRSDEEIIAWCRKVVVFQDHKKTKPSELKEAGEKMETGLTPTSP